MSYATDQAVVGVGRAHRLYVKKETDAGTMVEPAGTDLVLSTSEHIPEQDYEYTPDEQRRLERSRRQQIQLKLGVGKLTFDCYLKPPSAALTYPEAVDVLEGLFGSKSQGTSNSTTTAGCTTSAIELAAGGGAFHTVGDAIGVDVSATATPAYEAAFITLIATDNLSIDPPLSAAPATGKVVYNSSNFELINAPGSYSIWCEETDFQGDTGGVKVLLGCRINSIKFSVAGDGKPSMMSVDVSFREMVKCGRDALNATMSTTNGTDCVLTDSTKFDLGCIMLVGTEAMKVDALTYATHHATVQRGYQSTVAATHDNGAVVKPWLPTGVEVGAPVSGTLGKVRNEQEALDDVISAEITIDQKPKWLIDMKDNTRLPNQAIYPEHREVAFAGKVYYSQGKQKWWRQAQLQTTLGWMIVAGNQPGYMVALYLPNVDIAQPKLSGAAEQVVDITGYPYATSAGNDEVRLAFI